MLFKAPPGLKSFYATKVVKYKNNQTRKNYCKKLTDKQNRVGEYRFGFRNSGTRT